MKMKQEGKSELSVIERSNECLKRRERPLTSSLSSSLALSCIFNCLGAFVAVVQLVKPVKYLNFDCIGWKRQRRNKRKERSKEMERRGGYGNRDAHME